jgi:thioredoxin-like negative regulator of GroEL
MATISKALWLVWIAGMAAAHAQDTPPPIDWQTNYHQALARAKESSKPLLLDFYADWCGPCKMMEAQTYGDGRVRQALKEFVSLKVNIDKNTKVAFAFRVQSIPRTVVLNIHGEKVGDQVGFMDADDFMEFLENVREFTHKKVDGIVIQVPGDTAPAVSSKTLDIAKDAELGRLLELMSAADPDVRVATRKALMERPASEQATVLRALIGHAYLGARIAGWETLLESARSAEVHFDPWDPAGVEPEPPHVADPAEHAIPEEGAP